MVEADYDDEDTFLEDHADEVLAGHSEACIRNIIEAAYAHGVDGPESGARVAGSQLFEDGYVSCICGKSNE